MGEHLDPPTKAFDRFVDKAVQEFKALQRKISTISALTPEYIDACTRLRLDPADPRPYVNFSFSFTP
jgi:hypothetical protein